MITPEDIILRMIKQDGCHGISCYGSDGTWNQGIKCPIFDECEDDNNIVLKAMTWADERWLRYPHYSNFRIAHRFKVGDRVQYKDKDESWPYPPVVTVVEVAPASYGFIYRFVEDGIPACLISYCDEKMRLADIDEDAGKAKEYKS